MSNWFAYDEGRSVGKTTAEGDVILRDEDNDLGDDAERPQGAD